MKSKKLKVTKTRKPVKQQNTDEELEAMFSDWIDKADDTTSTKEKKEIEKRDKLLEEFRAPLTIYLLCMRMILAEEVRFQQAVLDMTFQDHFLTQKTMKTFFKYLKQDDGVPGDLSGIFWFDQVICKRILQMGLDKAMAKNDESHFAIAIEVVKEKLSQSEHPDWSQCK